jgi:hypothetical protein
MARAPGHPDLDHHAAALAAADAECAVRRVAGHLGEHHDVGEHGGRRAGEHAPRQIERASALVVLLRQRDVAAHDHAAQCARGPQLEQDARGDDLRHHAAELVRGAAAEDQVLPLVVGREPAEPPPQGAAVEPRGVHEPEERIEPAGLLVPLGAQRPDRVAVAVEVDDALRVVRHAVIPVLQHPVEIAEGVEADVVLVRDRARFEDDAAQVLQARPLVVAGAAERVAALRERPVHVVGGDADGLPQDGRRERQVTRGGRCDLRVERAARGAFVHGTTSRAFPAAGRGSGPSPPRAAP